MEAVTFEVKPSDAITVTAVYEALAHLRSATHAYVIFHAPDDDDEAVQQMIEEARHVARTHGVGQITIGNPRDWDTWNELETADGVEPDPERLDELISVQLPPDAPRPDSGRCTEQRLGLQDSRAAGEEPNHLAA